MRIQNHRRHYSSRSRFRSDIKKNYHCLCPSMIHEVVIMLRGQRFENDMVVMFINYRARPLVDLEIFRSQLNYHLSFLRVNDTVSDLL